MSCYISLSTKRRFQGLNINPNNFWDGFIKAVHYLSPINNNLEKRETIQKQIDIWHKSQR